MGVEMYHVCSCECVCHVFSCEPGVYHVHVEVYHVHIEVYHVHVEVYCVHVEVHHVCACGVVSVITTPCGCFV